MCSWGSAGLWCFAQCQRQDWFEESGLEKSRWSHKGHWLQRSCDLRKQGQNHFTLGPRTETVVLVTSSLVESEQGWYLRSGGGSSSAGSAKRSNWKPPHWLNHGNSVSSKIGSGISIDEKSVVNPESIKLQISQGESSPGEGSGTLGCSGWLSFGTSSWLQSWSSSWLWLCSWWSAGATCSSVKDAETLDGQQAQSDPFNNPYCSAQHRPKEVRKTRSMNVARNCCTSELILGRTLKRKFYFILFNVLTLELRAIRCLDETSW